MARLHLRTWLLPEEPPPRLFLAFVFSIFLLAGVLILAVFVWSFIVLPWQINHRYRETTCLVIGKRVDRRMADFSPQTHAYTPVIHIEYQVDGVNHRTWTYEHPAANWTIGVSGNEEYADEVFNKFAVGTSYPCWYDPEDPAEAVLVRGYRHLGSLWFPCVFILVGGLGLIWLSLLPSKHSEKS